MTSILEYSSVSHASEKKNEIPRAQELICMHTCSNHMPCATHWRIPTLQAVSRFPQENKHGIGSDWTFFHLELSTPPDQKKLKILQLFIIRVADHRFKLEQKIGTESPCAGFNFVPIRSDPMLMFLSGNRPSTVGAPPLTNSKFYTGVLHHYASPFL